ncbi:MAG: sigma-70 family RNA polymerase sigma factor [Gammaproteobacteria bacterium]
MTDRDQRITEAVVRERGRLLTFIRRRVPTPADAEDVLQDVFFDLLEAYRLPEPIEQIGAWLFRVARNRIVDRFRRRRPEQALAEAVTQEHERSAPRLEALLPAADAGPEAAYARAVMLEQLESALAELPREQRRVFVAHELEGRSFKELAAESGVGVNTLLARKRYAVLHLRRRLQAIRDEFTDR